MRSVTAESANHSSRPRRSRTGLADASARSVAVSVSDKVRVDLASAEASSSPARTQLATRLNLLIDAHGLSQSAAARRLGMTQPKISAIRNYKLRGISLERLMQALVTLDQHVEIIVKPGLD